MGSIPKLAEGFKLQVGTHNATVLEYLSEGGFAQIYKVKIDPKKGTSDIACLKRVIVPDKAGLNQLRKEVDVMKKLGNGRNIVRYYDSHAERLENGAYQVLVLMELCPNKSLLDFMNSKIKTKLTESEILKIMLDISFAVYDMHKLRLIHRDIKIENVLISSDNHFKLCDFGSTSAPLLPPNDQLEFQSMSHDILYQTTPQYRAPEMIDLYRCLPIDEKADIWALGCLLYKLCYYTTPFETSGDIAILHASFQFLPNPQYSGDLRNLIVIMLQENPFFRPNIVQIIILLAKIMNISFMDLRIEDYYNLGEYNFQALHDYQRKKQNEILEQQQLYFHQQSLASNNKSPNNLEKNVPIMAKNPITPSYNSQNTSTQSIQSQQNYKESQLHLQSRSNTGSATPLPNESVNQVNTSQDETEQGSIDDDSFAELEKLDNAEKRYPSLDDLVDTYPETAITDDNKVQHSTHASDGEVLSSENTYALKQKHYTSEIPNQQVPMVNEGNVITNPNLNKPLAEYEKKEAWENVKPKMDKQAEKLADDIFSRENVSPVLKAKDHEKSFEPNVRPKSNDLTGISKSKLLSRSHEEIYKTLENKGIEYNENKKENSLQGNNIPFRNNSEGATFSDYNKKMSDENIAETRFPPIDTTIMNPFPISQPHLNTSKPDSNTNAEFKKAYNPWGEFRQTSGTPRNVPNGAQSLTLDHVAGSLSNQLQSIKLQEKQSQSQMPTIPKKDEVFESNLIDLEVGLDSSSSSSLPSVMNPNKTKDLLNISERDVSVIDLSDDITETKQNEQKLHFKKRIPSINVPSSFSLHEEVIDFASDDENPENSSRMNRINIRNTLKKPKRKSGEHKRSESLTSDKKKIGIFGSKDN